MKSINTTKLVGLGLVSLCALTLGAPRVLAADPVANTEADVKFVIDDVTVLEPHKPGVINPNTPDVMPELVKPGKEGIGGNGTSTMNISWVSNFKFGDVKITGTTMTAFAKPTTLDWANEGASPADELVSKGTPTVGLANFLQVTDKTASNEGWHVQVTGTEFVEVDDQGAPAVPEKKLTGAEIFLTKPRLIGASGNDALTPGTTLAANENILNAGAKTAVSAADGTGQATWSLTWGAVDYEKTDTANATLEGITVSGDGKTATGTPTSGVKLSVPVSAKAQANKTYKANLNWTLVSGPKK